MFAIVRTGGKQYKVQPQKVIMIEKLDLPEGGSVILDKVLMVSDGKTQSLGFPYVEGAFVKGIILEQMRDDKVIVFKKKRRHNYRRKQGHRQYLSVVRITEIAGPNGMHFKSEESLKSSSPKKKVTEEKKTDKAPSPETKPVKSASPAHSKAAPKATQKKESKPSAPGKKASPAAKKPTPTKTKES